MKHEKRYKNRYAEGAQKPERRLEIDNDVLVDYWGKDKVLEIPYGVKELDKYSVWGLDCIQKVILPETVKEIGAHAFFMCYGLKEINIESVRKIGESAFSQCKKLKKIVSPEGVEVISESAFSECKNLREVTFPSTLKVIGDCSFWECKKLRKINLPHGLQKIEEFAFCDCKRITELYIPETVKSIGRMAFCDCKLKNVELPDTCQIEDAKSEPFGNADIIRYHSKAHINPEVK